MRAFLESAASAATICTFVVCTILLCILAKNLFDHGHVESSTGDIPSFWSGVAIVAFIVGAWVGSLIAVAKTL